MKCTWCDGSGKEPAPKDNRVEELLSYVKQLRSAMEEAMLTQEIQDTYAEEVLGGALYDTRNYDGTDTTAA